MALDKQRSGSLPCGGEGRTHPRGPPADDQDVDVSGYGERAGGFLNGGPVG
jgi:hypothetical protein